MTTKYRILEQQLFQYNSMIVGLTSESLTDYFDEISLFLSTKNIQGKVLLDYYSYNRSQKRRLYEIEYDGHDFPIKTIKRVTVTKTIKDNLNLIYQNANLPEVFFIK